MNKLLAAGAMALMLTLSACSGTPGPTVTVTETATVSPSPTPEVTLEEPLSPVSPSETVQGQRLSDEDFAAWVKERSPALAGIPASSIVSLAKRGCSAFDTGVTFREIAQVILDGDASPELKKAMGGIIGAGTANYCPEHSDKIG
jgi:hypothetical protein